MLPRTVQNPVVSGPQVIRLEKQCGSQIPNCGRKKIKKGLRALVRLLLSGVVERCVFSKYRLNT